MELPVLNRQHNSVAVESWDDDDELQGVLELKSSLLSASGPRSKTDRESISSRMSFISDTGFDFDDEPQEKVLLAPEGDSTRAIESAKMAGIPLPLNIPASALKGGTIKRLGTKKATMVEHDDWSEDLELPLGGLAIKTAQFTDFPGSIKYSPQQMRVAAPRQEPVVMSRVPANVSKAADKLNTQLNKYREDDDDENWDGDDIPTLKVAGPPLSRNPFGLASPPLTEIKSKPAEDSDDDFGFDDDFELPEGKGLQLKHPQARSPAALMDSDFEEWIEGSRNQGTSVRARSTRSSSISMSSVQNFDSEDEGMDGLQFPEGPIDFEEILAKRKQNETPDLSMDFELEKKGSKEDFLTGLEIGDVDFLDPSKLTLNRNVKHKTTRQASPVRRTAVALTFSSPPPSHEVSAKVSSVGPTRLTKPTRLPGTQSPSTSIVEPPVQSRQKKPEQRQRRISNPPAVDHNTFAFGAMGSFFHPHPTPPPSIQGGSGTRRLVKRPSQSLQQSPPPQLAQPPTTTSAQLLKVKRSMPSIARLPPTSPTRIARPPSRSETPTAMAVLNAIRSTTPTDRAVGISQPVQSRRTFIPGGSTIKQSPNVNIKAAISTRPTNRVTVEEAEKTRPSSRISNSRQLRTTPPPPSRIPQPTTLETLKKDAAATRLMTRPAKKKNFGDGTELEAFDDLPTSQKAEQKFVKEPIAKGAPRCLRAKAIPTQTPPPPATPPVTKSDSNIPSFARDTNASRTAREQKMAALASSPAAKHWKNMMAAREKGSPRTRAAAKKPQQRPHLIKPLGNQSSIPKAVKGMTYNPRTFCWEGNEHSLEDFDRHQAITPPRPALITNINSNSSGMPKGFQVVGGMVFDPQRMCWLKADADEDGGEESDPFEGLEDLRDELASCDGTNVSGLGTSCGEFMVGEEFDVGPEFVRRQREEEERWRRRVDGWVSGSVAGMVGMRDPQSEWRRRWELWNIVVNN